MRISKADLESYRQTLIDLGRQASDYVVGELEGVRDDGRSSMRNATIKALNESIGLHGDAAQALAGQLFDEVCASEGINATSALYPDIIDKDLMAGKVRWLCRKLVEGDRAGYVKRVGVLADFYTKRCNYVAQMRNCYGANMRYARIPTGSETCDWCMMLASRGFVYYTERDAEAANHQNCDCICIPGRGGDTFNDFTQVEGYDPDEYYRMWRESGFMPPKTNPTPYRMVYNKDTTAGQRYQNMRRSATRRIRRDSPERRLAPQETERYYERMNNAATLQELEREYKEIIREFERMGDSLNDADWEDIGNHYAYLLERYFKRRKRG